MLKSATEVKLELIIAIAMICHETNKAYCESIGDHSQKHWNEAEEWQRESAVAGVKFRINNPKAPASAQHDAWMQDKINDGWKYGPTKDPELKTHHCIVPYEELPEEQKIKDRLFQGVVDSFTYLERNTHNTFADALEALKKGKRVARTGWEGKNLYAFMQIPADIPADVIPKMQSVPQSVKDVTMQRIKDGGPGLSYRNQFALVKSNNEVNGWVPSVSDILAEDWLILD